MGWADTYSSSARTLHLRASAQACALAAVSSWSWDSCSGPARGQRQATGCPGPQPTQAQLSTTLGYAMEGGRPTGWIWMDEHMQERAREAAQAKPPTP